MIHEALAAIKADIKMLEKDTTGHNNKYVSLPAILDFINPLLAQHKISILIDNPDHNFEEGIKQYHFVVRLSCGESTEVLNFFIPEAKVPVGKGDADAKAIQNCGATLTYAQRYIYQVVFGLPNSDEDPDGIKVSPADLVWWFKNIPNHKLNEKIDDKGLFAQFKMFSKGELTQEQYKERGY